MTTLARQPAMAYGHAAAVATTLPTPPRIRLGAQVSAALMANTTAETVKALTDVDTTAKKFLVTSGKAILSGAATPRPAVSRTGFATGKAEGRLSLSANCLPAELQKPSLWYLQNQVQQLQRQIHQQQCLQLQQYQQQLQLRCRQQQLLSPQQQQQPRLGQQPQHVQTPSEFREQYETKSKPPQQQQQTMRPQEETDGKSQKQEGGQAILSLAVAASQPYSVSKAMVPSNPTLKTKFVDRDTGIQMRYDSTIVCSSSSTINASLQPPPPVTMHLHRPQAQLQQRQEPQRHQQQPETERQHQQQSYYSRRGTAQPTQQTPQLQQTAVITAATKDTSAQAKKTGGNHRAQGQARPPNPFPLVQLRGHAQAQQQQRQLQTPVQQEQAEQLPNTTRGGLDLRLPGTKTQDSCHGDKSKLPLSEDYVLLRSQQQLPWPGTTKESTPLRVLQPRRRLHRAAIAFVWQTSAHLLGV